MSAIAAELELLRVKTPRDGTTRHAAQVAHTLERKRESQVVLFLTGYSGDLSAQCTIIDQYTGRRWLRDR